MSTGALASLLGQQPYSFTGLKTIGKIVFILDLVLFVAFSACITYRFCTNNRSLNRSLHHPHESFFFGSFFVSIALIIYCIELYAVPSCGPWLIRTQEVLYWIYAGTVMLVAVFQYHVIFDREQLPVTEAMPVWILPMYPFLVLGPLGSTLLKSQPTDSGLPIWIGSLTFAGLGWTFAYIMLTLYITRLVNSDIPEASKRPGMFVAVGPAAYTANTFVALGMYAPKHIPENFLGITSVPVGDIFKAMGVAAGIFMWLIAFWFSAFTTVSVLNTWKHSHFTLNYWGFIFPNAGLVIALIYIANALQSAGMKGVCSAATIILVILWLFAAVTNVRAVYQKLILWPGMDEDMEDMEGHGQNPSEAERQEEQGDANGHDNKGDARHRSGAASPPTWV
jgi:tellurite resistance protein TehA-like permease